MSSSHSPSLTLLSSLHLPAISSGSGMALQGSRLYLVGDDAPALYVLSLEGELLQEYLLLPEHAGSRRILKALKPDLESLFLAGSGAEATLFAFGSGSKTPGRDLLLQIPLQDPAQVKTHVLTSFYNQLSAKMGIGREQLNLEGALLLNEDLYLFNRGTNDMICLSWPLFLQHLTGELEAEALTLELHPLRLPKIGDKEARFSGACGVPGTSKILFTATVEDTDNWIDDGEVLGSYIGLLDTKKLQQDLSQSAWLLTDQKGQPLAEKLESVAVLEQQPGQLLLAAVADNDDGTSLFYRLQLSLSLDHLKP